MDLGPCLALWFLLVQTLSENKVSCCLDMILKEFSQMFAGPGGTLMGTSNANNLDRIRTFNSYQPPSIDQIEDEQQLEGKLDSEEDYGEEYDDREDARRNRLGGRDDSLDARRNRLNGVDDRLDAKRNRLNEGDDRLDAKRNRLDREDDRLDVKRNRLDGGDDRLDARRNRLNGGDDRLDAKRNRLDGRDDRLDAKRNRLDGGDDRLDAKRNRLDGRDDRLDAKRNRLDGGDDRLDAKRNRLDGRDDRLDAKRNRLDGRGTNDRRDILSKVAVDEQDRARDSVKAEDSRFKLANKRDSTNCARKEASGANDKLTDARSRLLSKIRKAKLAKAPKVQATQAGAARGPLGLFQVEPLPDPAQSLYKLKPKTAYQSESYKPNVYEDSDEDSMTFQTRDDVRNRPRTGKVNQPIIRMMTNILDTIQLTSKHNFKRAKEKELRDQAREALQKRFRH